MKLCACLPAHYSLFQSKLADLRPEPLSAVVCVYLAAIQLEADAHERVNTTQYIENEKGDEKQMKKWEKFVGTSPDRLIVLLAAEKENMTLMTRPGSMCNMLCSHLHNSWEEKIRRNESPWFDVSVPESPYPCFWEDAQFSGISQVQKPRGNMWHLQ